MFGCCGSIIDFSIPRARFETKVNGSEIIIHLKKTLKKPPLLVLASGFISQNDRDAGQQLCEEADDFLAKDSGLDVILKQITELLDAQKNIDFESKE